MLSFTDGQRRVPQWSERSRFSFFPPTDLSDTMTIANASTASKPPLLQINTNTPSKSSNPWRLCAPNNSIETKKLDDRSLSSWHEQQWCTDKPTEEEETRSGQESDDLRTTGALHDSTTTTQLASSTSSSCSSGRAVSSDDQTPNLYLGTRIPSGKCTSGDWLSSKLNLHFQPPHSSSANCAPNDFPVPNTSQPPIRLEWKHLTCDLRQPQGILHRIGRVFNLTEDKMHATHFDAHTKRKRILQAQSGHFAGGTVNAIIGASGAGKSTLLECLAGRRRAGVGGLVQLYGDTACANRSSQRLQVAYLPQTEALIQVLTVRETLLFASKLKNYRKLRTHAEHAQLVDALLSELRLLECADTYVQSVSGGQRKRVAIGAELISGPDVILLDEPTSGLDSCTAYLLVRLLRGLTSLAANSGGNGHFRAPVVACSIHQPSGQLLGLFHNLYVLSNDGRCIYQNAPTQLLARLSSLNLHCPPYQDPVAYVTEIASGQLGASALEKLAQAHTASQTGRSLASQLASGLASGFTGGMSNGLFNGLPYALATAAASQQNGDVESGEVDTFAVPHTTQCSADWDWRSVTSFSRDAQEPGEKMSSVIAKMRNQRFPLLYHSGLLIRRTYLGTIREPKLTWLRVFQTLFIGLLMSFLYDRPIGAPDGCFWTFTNGTGWSPASASTGPSAQTSTHENVAFVFFVTLFLVMSSMMPTVLTFPSEVRVLMEERANGYYACGSYYVAKVVADTPFVIFNALLFCALVYPLTGQLMLWHRFALFACLANLVALIAHCIGMLFGTIYVHSVTSAVFMAPLSMSPVFLMSGFFGKISALPLALKPIAYLSYVRYVFECFLIALYGFARCQLPQTESNITVAVSQPLIATPHVPEHEPISESVNEARSVLANSLPNDLLRNLSAYLPVDNGVSEQSLDSNELWSRLQGNLINELVSGGPASTNSVMTTAAFPSNSTGSMVLDYYNLQDSLFMQNILILGGCFVLLRLIAYAILVAKTNRFK